MNLIENEQLNARNKKSKIIMSIIVVIIVLLLLISIGLVYMIYDIQKNLIKLTIDTKQIANFSEDMFLFEDNTIYFSIRDFAKLIGYESYNGDHTSEISTKGYIQNEYEEASFTLNSDKIYKNLLSETDNEYYDLEDPIKMQNNKLYMSLDGIQIATNTMISYNESNKQFTVYTLPYLVTYYTELFNDAAIENGQDDFSNQKAILQNLIVVKNSNGKYGVRTLDNREIIGTKYASIKFVENSKDFIVTTDERKMGILSSTGATKIQPEYDEIKQIDKNLNLYMVKSNNKYGVINQNGNIVIYLEYDKIGVDTTQFMSNNIKNKYLLFDNCIAVERDKKWGFFNKAGQLIVPIEYDGIGCVSGTQTTKTSNNLLIIPEYEGIVVEKNKKYGIINSTGKTYLPCVLDSIYSITTSGQDAYYMVQGEKTIELIDYFDKYIIKNDVQDNNANEITNNTETPSNSTDNNINYPPAG